MTVHHHLALKVSTLGKEAKYILNQPNAGGSSIWSEALAMEVLQRTLGCREVYSEMEIVYFNENWKKCDFITCLRSERIGVSVTRALLIGKLAPKNPDDLEICLYHFLQKKIHGLVVSRVGVDERFNFQQSVLFVWSPDRITTRLVKKLFHQLGPELTENIFLMIAETNSKHLTLDFHKSNKWTVEVFY